MQRDMLGMGDVVNWRKNGPRVLSRNRKQYEDSVNRYEYVRSNPARFTDPRGYCPHGEDHKKCLKDCLCKNVEFPGLTRPSNLKYCKCFIECEENDTDWVNSLPNCPCTLSGAKDSEDWLDPTDASDYYHPGAAKCIRSKKTYDSGCGLTHGQQCCYDDKGKLITDGLGAGTPDIIAPIGISGILGHNSRDVTPYKMCKSVGLAKDYLKIRPPNNGNNCIPNNVDPIEEEPNEEDENRKQE